VFIHHVIEGLKGQAADPATGEVGRDDLVSHVRKNVNPRAKEWEPELGREADKTSRDRLLYQDPGLLADLACLGRVDPPAFAGFNIEFEGLRGFKARDFSAALAHHLPPGEPEVAEKRKDSEVAILIALATEGAELFRDASGKAFSTITDSERIETVALRNHPYKNWLKRRYYQQTGFTPGSENLNSALDVLEM